MQCRLFFFLPSFFLSFFWPTIAKCNTCCCCCCCPAACRTSERVVVVVLVAICRVFFSSFEAVQPRRGSVWQHTAYVPLVPPPSADTCAMPVHTQTHTQRQTAVECRAVLPASTSSSSSPALCGSVLWIKSSHTHTHRQGQRHMHTWYTKWSKCLVAAAAVNYNNIESSNNNSNNNGSTNFSYFMAIVANLPQRQRMRMGASGQGGSVIRRLKSNLHFDILLPHSLPPSGTFLHSLAGSHSSCNI